MKEIPDHFNPHPVTKHDVLCDKVFISESYPQNCEICLTIRKARAEGYKKGWEDSSKMWERLSNSIYYVPKGVGK